MPVEPGNWAQGNPKGKLLSGTSSACYRSHGSIQPVGTVSVLTFVLALGLSIACLAWGETGGEQYQPHLRCDEEPLYALQGTPEGRTGLGPIWDSVCPKASWRLEWEWAGSKDENTIALSSYAWKY